VPDYRANAAHVAGHHGVDEVVEGPMAASYTAFAVPFNNSDITTAVSTKESKGSDSQMNMVVERNNKSVWYDGNDIVRWLLCAACAASIHIRVYMGLVY
jgi:L-lactate utilization protein LutB